MNRIPSNQKPTQPSPSTARSQSSHWPGRIPLSTRPLRDRRTHTAAPPSKAVNPTRPDRQPKTIAATAMNTTHRGKPWEEGAKAPATESSTCGVVLDALWAEDAVPPSALSAGSGGATAGPPSTSPSTGSTGECGAPICSGEEGVNMAGAAENPAPSHASVGGGASGWMSKPSKGPASAARGEEVWRLRAPGRPRERRVRAMVDNRGGGEQRTRR